jgi:hypothetical protein
MMFFKTCVIAGIGRRNDKISLLTAIALLMYTGTLYFRVVTNLDILVIRE